MDPGGSLVTVTTLPVVSRDTAGRSERRSDRDTDQLSATAEAVDVARRVHQSPAPEERVTLKHTPRHRLSEGDVCASQLDWFDREIVRYVLLWGPEGDVWDEDVYPVFGMTVEQLVDRFHWIIATFVPRLGDLAKSDRELLDKVRNLPRIFGQAL